MILDFSDGFFTADAKDADMERTYARLLAVLVALAAGGLGYVLSADPILALALVLVYGVATWLVVTHYDALPEGVRGGADWDVAKWNGVWIGTLTFGGFGTLYPTGVPLDVGFALALVVYGVSALGYFVAVAQLTAAHNGGTETESSVDSGAAHAQ